MLEKTLLDCKPHLFIAVQIRLSYGGRRLPQDMAPVLGHAAEMAQGAAVTISLILSSIPLMAGVAELAADGMLPAGDKPE